MGDESVAPEPIEEDLVDPSIVEAARHMQTIDEEQFLDPGDMSAADAASAPGRGMETIDDIESIDGIAPIEPPSAPDASRETVDEIEGVDAAADSNEDNAEKNADDEYEYEIDAASANQQTIDDLSPPSPALGDGSRTVDHGIERTLDEMALRKLSADEESSGQTIHERDNSQTIDIVGPTESRGREPAAETPGKGTLAERRIAQTVDTGDFLPPSNQGKDEGTVKEIAEAATLDGVEIPADAERIQATWRGALGVGATSMSSIKREFAAAASQGSTLVIHPRRFSLTARRDSRSGADYDILRLLGEGGMGKVYAARQASIDRTVAVKTLKADTAQERQQRDKFLSEAVVTGELEHPNIVPIYDVGLRDDGSLFYSMKRVQGTPWMDVIHGKSLHENLEILMKVADAMAFAHDKKIVHRDLKPENVMLGGYGEVLVMDWGLAIPSDGRRIGGMEQTVSMGGTPAYMAPEMAAGPFEKIGYGSDIYLLGAILYEIVTGRPPHSGDDVMKCLFAAARNEIQPTNKSGELLDIALRAMSNKPEDRYATVAEFQSAIRDYLSHSESIALSTRAAEDLQQARTSDNYQQFAKALFGFEEAHALWQGNERAKHGRSETALAYAGSAKRKGDFDLGVSLLDADDPSHRALLHELQQEIAERDTRQRRLQTMRRVLIGGAAAIFLIVVTATGLVYSQYREAVAQKEIADQEAENARLAQKDAESQRQIARKEKEQAEELKDLAELRRQAAEFASLEAEYASLEAELQSEIAHKNEGIAKDERIEAETQRAAAVVERTNAQYQAYVAQIGLAAAHIEENAFDSAREVLEACPEHLRNWEWGRLKYLCAQDVRDVAAPSKIEALAVSPDGSRFVSVGWDGQAAVWKLATGPDGKPDPRGEVTRLFELEGVADGSTIGAVAFSPDGSLIATGGDDPAGRLRLWDAATGEEMQEHFQTEDAHTRQVNSIEFSPDGRWLLTASHDKTVKRWNVADGRLLWTYAGHTSWVWDASFAPATKLRQTDDARSRQIVSASQDGTALVWQVDWTMEEQTRGTHLSAPFRGHEGPIHCVSFSHDGKQVVSGGYDKRVLVWRPVDILPFEYERSIRQQPVAPPKFTPLVGHTALVRSVRFSDDDKLIVSGGHDNTVRIWHVEAGRLHKTLRGHGSWVSSARFLLGDAWVVSGSHDGQMKLWDVAGYSESRVLEGWTLEGHADAILSARFSADGGRVVTASRDRSAKIWNLNTGEAEQQLLEGHSYLASNVAYFPNETHIATAAFDNTVRIWDVATGTEVRLLNGTGHAAAMTVSPSGRWILTGGDDDTAKLWDADKLLTQPPAGDASGPEPDFTLKGFSGYVTAVAFSPDGKYAATADATGVCIVWDLGALSANNSDAAKPERLHVFNRDTSLIRHIAFTNDNKLFVAAGSIVCPWNVETGQPDTERILKHPTDLLSMAVTADGRSVYTCSADGAVWQWDARRAAPLRKYRHNMLNVPFAPSDNTGQGNVVNSLVLSRDDAQLLTIASNDGTVRLWDAETGDELEQNAAGNSPLLDFQRVRGLVWTAAFSPDGDQVLTVGGNTAQLWDVAADGNKTVRHERMTFSPHGVIASASFSADGAKVVTSSWDNSARIWDAATGRDLLKLTGGHTRQVNTAVFSRDGQRVLTSSSDGAARLWRIDWEKWRQSQQEGAFDADASSFAEVVLVFAGHKGEVYDAVFSPDESMVLTASADKTARLWNTATGEPLGVLVSDGAPDAAVETSGHVLAVLCAQFSGDGRRVITGSADNTAKIWNIEQPAKPHVANTLGGHTASVTSVAFSPNGAARALTGSEDYTAKVWDADNGKQILTLKGHEQEVTSVDFSSDGVYALTGSRDGAAIIWLASPDGWQKAPTDAPALPD